MPARIEDTKRGEDFYARFLRIGYFLSDDDNIDDMEDGPSLLMFVDGDEPSEAELALAERIRRLIDETRTP